MEQQSEALSECEARYRSLLNASFDAIAVHDVGRLLETNPAFERMFGCGSPDAVGRPVLDFFPQEAHAAVVEHWQQGLAEPFQTQGRRKDGAVFPLEVVSRTLPYQGRDVQVCLLRDLSDQKAVEEQRVRLLVEKQRVTVMRRFVDDASTICARL
jgi:PAS domain S-box-containing protein